MHTVFAGLKEFQPEMTKRPTAMGQPAFQSWPELNGQLGFWLANTSVCFLYTDFCNKYVKIKNKYFSIVFIYINLSYSFLFLNTSTECNMR